ncbi:molecular chaperone DnaJ [Methylomarinovum caldicuralii]|uniref:Molecular chaperone DnaJ n=1 Tax=Methylomarinovum caldicuralii TaxID=438856 RepID=A0AAU9CCU7_9GAMM|nr:J domain-containing protein [Methylomarinovum caldicuralii]BCX80750.1 molecular chaperone DnaJ [Methylomarinovum caldicuralii]
MKPLDPYVVLQVGPEADDETIRRAYLDQVRRHPPERDPEIFRQIQWAYEQIRDERSRIHHRLFHVMEPEEIAAALPAGRPSLAQLRALLRDCAQVQDDG